MLYKYLADQHNGGYDPEYWAKCEGLYSGGKGLLGNSHLMDHVFPRHLAEIESVYQERRKCAFYIPYAGEIVNFMVSSLFADSLTVTSEPQAPPFYDEFYEDTTLPGGNSVSINKLLRLQLLTALKKKRAWTLIDLPAMPIAEINSLADEERTGLLRAYAVPLHPENVCDWERDNDGRLEWVLVRNREQKRNGLVATRDTIVDTYTYYDWEHWDRYRVEYNKDKPPNPEDDIPLDGSGRHSFGEVPIACLELEDDIWVMGKLESVAREWFNKRNALSWAQRKSLLPLLYEFQAPELPMSGAMISEIQQDPNRAKTQTRGQGYVQTRGHQDRAEYIGPPSAPYDHVSTDLDRLRDEMYRVTDMIALSIGTSAAALGRSAESKSHDKSSLSVVLTELSTRVREHMDDILRLIGAGRRDAPMEHTFHGMDSFDSQSVSDALDEMTQLQLLKLPSPTMHRIKAKKVGRMVVGGDTDPEDLKKMDEEFDRNITDEEMMPHTEPQGGSEAEEVALATKTATTP